MVLAAFILVLAAAATFAAGIATSRTSDSLVYVSILLSLAAFAILAIASIRARQAVREGGTEEDWTTARARSLDTEAATGPLLQGLDENQLDMTPNWKRDARQRWRDVEPELDDDLDRQLEAEEDEADFEVPAAPVPVAAGYGTDDGNEDQEEGDWIPDDESLATAAYAVAGFEDEDEDVEEIGDSDELEDIDQLDQLDQLEDIGGFEFGRRATRGEPALAEPEFDEIDEIDEIDEVDEIEEEEPEDVLDVPEPPPVRRTPSPARRVSAGASGSSLDLIDDYDDLTAAEIVPRLHDLDVASLRWVQRRERSGGKRTTILNQVDELIAEHGGSRRTPTAKRTPAKRTPAKRTPAKRTPTKKKATKKSATKKSATKKSAAKKTAAKKTAAKKTAAKKTATRAKKTSTKKTATRAKKASPGKRTSKSSGRR